MKWCKVKLGNYLKQYRIEHLVQDNRKYKQVTISKHEGVKFRGEKMGKEIGRKRQFIINLQEHPNTLMFVRQGVEDGSIGVAPNEVDGCIATENMPMFSIENIDVEFLKILLKSQLFKEQVAKIPTTGSAQKAIHERQLLEIELVIPDDIIEQKEIVKSYTHFELQTNNLQTELSRQQDLLSQLRQSFLREAMQGKLVKQDPNDGHAKDLLDQIRAEKAKLGKKEKELPPIKPEEIPFEIPQNWLWCRLGEIAYIASGSTPKQDAFVAAGVPYFKMYNLKNQKIDFYYKPQYIKREIHEGHLKRSRALPGDVLMNIVGPPLGKLAIIPEEFPECNFNQAAVLIRPFVKGINQWIFWYLNEMSEINSIVTKGVAGQDNISVTQSNNIKVPLPTIAELNRILKRLEELMTFCDELQESIKTSRELNEMLLQQVLKEALTS